MINWWNILKNEGKISPEDCSKMESRGIFSLPNEKSTKSIKIAQARSLGITIYNNIPKLNPSHHWYKIIPYSFAKKYLLIPIRNIDEKTVEVLLSNIFLLDPLEELKFAIFKNLKISYADEGIVSESIEICYKKKNPIDEISDSNRQHSTNIDAIDTIDILSSPEDTEPIIRLINIILIEAIKASASDIHMEQTESGLRIRYRIDGTLQNFHSPIKENQKQIISRIKVMAHMNIAEHRLPQDGRIPLKMGSKEIDLRVSTVPINHGERIVIRILDQKNVAFGLNYLEINTEVKSLFKKWINTPEGMILVTGPTGSGKTTTLYSALGEIDKEKTNIMTIEDPVEYQLPGISQINVNKKINFSFAEGLRHILRQDPNVIMIGEIRDKETATIAIQAALTGHLVMSTIHSNNSPATILRLIDLGIPPYLISSALVGVISQRLVRKLCNHCKTPEKNSSNFSPEGCPQCHFSGYSGRIAVYEIMDITSAMKTYIAKEHNAVKLKNIAIKEGMITLNTYAMSLANSGITSIEEINKIIGTTI